MICASSASSRESGDDRPAEVEAEIARLFHAEHWKVGTIATQLGVHEDSLAPDRNARRALGAGSRRQGARGDLTHRLTGTPRSPGYGGRHVPDEVADLSSAVADLGQPRPPA